MLFIQHTLYLKHANTVILAMRDRSCQNDLKTISSLHLHKQSVCTYLCHWRI